MHHSALYDVTYFIITVIIVKLSRKRLASVCVCVCVCTCVCVPQVCSHVGEELRAQAQNWKCYELNIDI